MVRRVTHTTAGTSPAGRSDRRVQRTREALRDALLSLLPEAGWDGIDVAMLCERANVGRSTFYLHYADKTALLRGAFGDLQAYVLAASAPSESARPFAFLPALLAHVHEQQEVFRSLLGRRSGQVVQDCMRDILIELFARTDRAVVQPVHADDARHHMLAGGLMQLMVWWLGHAAHLTPTELEARFLAFSVRGGSQ